MEIDRKLDGEMATTLEEDVSMGRCDEEKSCQRQG
jgi:hypothetical protein